MEVGELHSRKLGKTLVRCHELPEVVDMTELVLSLLVLGVARVWLRRRDEAVAEKTLNDGVQGGLVERAMRVKYVVIFIIALVRWRSLGFIACAEVVEKS